MKEKILYGTNPSQFGELYLPDGLCKGTVCIFHGGFWTMPYDLHQFDEAASYLCNSGYCVWNIEYTRIGEPNRHWQDTFNNAIEAINALETIATHHKSMNIEDLYIVGHSAGGHLALWLNSIDLNLTVKKYIGLAPILDLNSAYEQNSGNGAVEKLLDCTPKENPERYREYSPINLMHKKNAEIIVHGIEDDYVPIEWSKSYYSIMNGNNDKTELIELEACSHMDFIDTESTAFKVMVSKIQDL